MAEFKEVMRRKEEMCNCYDDCIKCPLRNIGCEHVDMKFIEEIEGLIMNWEKPIDWSKVEVDTKILVRVSEQCGWHKRYFAKYENGEVYAYSYGRTSWSAESALPWKYAKLWKGAE